MVYGIFHLGSLIFVELQAECKFNHIYYSTFSARDCARGVLSFLFFVFVEAGFNENSFVFFNLLVIVDSLQDANVITPFPSR